MGAVAGERAVARFAAGAPGTMAVESGAVGVVRWLLWVSGVTLGGESTARRETGRNGSGMGRIVVRTRVTNLFDEDESVECGMFVDTGAGALILPAAWKERLGRFKRAEAVELQMANRDVVRGEACWPVEVKIEGFRPVSNEVIFVDMKSEENQEYEPLLGYVILEQAQAAVDMLGHRLVPVKYIDMK